MQYFQFCFQWKILAFPLGRRQEFGENKIMAPRSYSAGSRLFVEQSVKV